VSVETLVAVAVGAAVSVAVGTTAVFVAVVVGCAVSVEVGTAVAVGVGPTKTSALTGPMVRLEEVAVTELAYVPGVDGTAA
jgi:urea transporter